MAHVVESLLVKNAFKTDTIITAKYMVNTETGPFTKTDDFHIQSIQIKANNYWFKSRNLKTDAIIDINWNSVIQIDGMTPDRFIDTYELNADGSIKNVGKKRGRKTKPAL